MTLSQMIDRPTFGDASGVCYLCSAETMVGHAKDPSSSFTAWAQCFGGDVICEYCYSMLKDRRFRQRSWMATPGTVRYTTQDDREWLLPALLSPPEPPFAFYVTVSYKKQGWITLLNRVSYSGNHYWCGTDFADAAVAMHVDKIRDWSALLDVLREQKIPKSALVSGMYGPHHYRRAMDTGILPELERARLLAGNPAWEVVVNVHH